MARACNAGYEGTSIALRPALPGPHGRTRTAYSASLRALRPACLAVQGKPTRHVCAHQPECELRQLRICSAGKANQVDARAMIRADKASSAMLGLSVSLRRDSGYTMLPAQDVP